MFENKYVSIALTPVIAVPTDQWPKNVAKPAKAAARPTKEWKPATSSGMFSISTERAAYRPTPEDSAFTK